MQGGVYNGARGEVVGFAFSTSYPQQPLPPVNIMHEEVHEIPIVFVQLEKETGYSVNSTTHNVIPFSAVCQIDKKFLNKYHRWQLPLKPASAITVHKSQSL